LDYVYVAILACASVALRVPLLSRGLWRDEGLTYADVSGPTFGSVLHAISRSEMTPPLYFLFLHAWTNVAGASELWLRLPSLACIVATIVVLYAVCMALEMRVAALVAATIVAFAPLTMQAALEARAYGLTLLLASLTLLCFVHALRSAPRGRPWWAAGFALACVALEYTHYAGLMVTAALAAICAAGLLARRNRFALPFAATAFALLLAVPGVLFEHGRVTWHNSLDLRSTGIEVTLFRQLFDLRIFGPYAVEQFVILQVAIAAWLFAAWRRGFDPIDRYAAVCLIVVAAGIAGDVMLAVPGTRHVTAYAPALWTFCAIAGERFLRWIVRPSDRLTLVARAACGAFAAAFFALCIARAPQTYAQDRAPLSGARSLARFVQNDVPGPVLFVAIPDYVASGIAYYFRQDPRVEIRGVPQWEDPSFFTLYSDQWDSPGFIASTAARIRSAARGRTVVIGYDPHPNTWNANDYPRSLDLVAALTTSCVREHRVFSGYETIAVTVLCPRRD
jgi:mannosyltransferase